MAAIAFQAAALLAALAGAGGASADLVASEVIRSGAAVSVANTETGPDGGAPDDPELLGREARRTLYPGQPVTLENTRPPRLVQRNDIVSLRYALGNLELSTTGRAMADGAAGEGVNILNLGSRKMVSGTVQPGGWVLVQ